MPLDDQDVVALLSSTGLVFVASVVSGLSKLVERIIIVRALSPAAWGDVSIGLSIMLLGTTFSLLGLAQGVPRYMSRFDDERHVRGTWLSGLVVACTVAAVVAAVLYFNATLVAELLFEDPDSPRMLSLFVLCIPLYAAYRLAMAGYRGMENTAYKVLLQLMSPAVRITLLVALLAAGVGFFAPAVAYLAAFVVVAVVGHLLLNRLVTLVGPTRTRVVELLRFSVPLMMSAFVMVLLTKTDTLMVGYFRSSAEVGLYSAAYPLANGMLMVLTAIGYLYFPMASRFDAQDEHEEVTAIYELTTKWGLVISFPLFLVYVLFPGDLLALVYGAFYRDAALAFAVLAVGGLSSLVFGRCQETLSALGKTGWILATNVGVYVLNVALNLVLIPAYGILGAAAASMFSFLLLNGGLWLILRAQFGISPFSRHTLRTLALYLVVLLPAGALAAQVVTLTIWTLVPIGLAAGLATLAITTVGGCLQAEDRVVLEAFEAYVGVRVPLIRRYLPDAPSGF